MSAGSGPLYLGIDLGTSSVKVVTVDGRGQIVAQGSGDYPIDHPQPDHAEQDPAAWWTALVQAVRQVTMALPNVDAVAALAVTGQMHGTVLLDAHDQLIHPAIIWPDQRSRAEVATLTTQIGAARLIAITGSPLATGFQAATLAWLRHNAPKTWAAIRHILLPKDYLRWRMTGVFATDPSDAAGTLLLDTNTRTWATELLDRLEVDPAWLPPIQPATAQAGTLLPEIATELGLPPGLPVITGAADTPCSALGAGVVAPGTLLLTLSSGGQLLLPATTVRTDPHGRIHTFCSALEPETGPGWYQMAALLNVGLALRWLRDQVWGLPGDTGYAQITAWAASAPAGSHGLIFLPYLAGERTPHMDPTARGAFLGLTSQHGRAEMSRAVLEGISLACYDAFTVLAELGGMPQRMVLAGGGAANPFWRQLLADIFGRTVHPLAVTAQSAIGAALLAGTGVGHFELLPMAQAWTRYGTPVTPDPAAHALYQGWLPHFRAAYVHNRALFAVLHDAARDTE